MAGLDKLSPLILQEKRPSLRAAIFSIKILERVGYFLVFSDLLEGVSRFRATGAVLQFLQHPVGEANLIGFVDAASHF
ncbi:MAG: hypothetical protein A2092_18155 [Rhodobacteraceae bacterium GWE1_64_9]|nr:MAG: hypothetical protein A2092_18155 [Rhodobacteraceae bacterium GWE1_64_9]OHC50184.1 MAG: hypothetical protein A2X69_05710 [Rhodobacteraceae bacterium GWF1_65_7]